MNPLILIHSTSFLVKNDIKDTTTSGSLSFGENCKRQRPYSCEWDIMSNSVALIGNVMTVRGTHIISSAQK